MPFPQCHGGVFRRHAISNHGAGYLFLSYIFFLLISVGVYFCLFCVYNEKYFKTSASHTVDFNDGLLSFYKIYPHGWKWFIVMVVALYNGDHCQLPNQWEFELTTNLDWQWKMHFDGPIILKFWHISQYWNLRWLIQWDGKRGIPNFPRLE